ncbi:MAG: hypothetical protein QXV35_04085 [Archaeoglobaceae archaeon]
MYWQVNKHVWSKKWFWIILYIAMIAALLNSIARRAMMRKMLMNEIMEDVITQGIIRQEMMEEALR